MTRFEVCALAAVLMLTGVLTVLTPPDRAGGRAPPAAAACAPGWLGCREARARGVR